MATTVMTIQSTRTAGQFSLRGLVSNITSSVGVNELFLLPTGFGDCILLDVWVDVSGIQTIATHTNAGPYVQITTPAGVGQQSVGCEKWTDISATEIGAFIDPDQARFWRDAEALNVQAQTIDTGAGNTSDVLVYCTVKKIE